MNHYPAWKNLLVAAVVLLGVFVAVPNLFGKAPSVQVSRSDNNPLADVTVEQVSGLLDEAQISRADSYIEEGRLLVQFDDVQEQLRASELLRDNLSDKAYVVAVTLAPRTPAWLRNLGLQPMSLGLDLRGGVHFLFEVDLEAAIAQRLDIISNDLNRQLRRERIRRNVRVVGKEVRVRVTSLADLDIAEQMVNDREELFDIRRSESGDEQQLTIRATDDQVRAWQDFAIQQNTITLRNRVNALGVAEPVVQRQGVNRIVVQLPGVQDPAQAERILDATATLEFRLVCEGESAFEAERRGRAPLGCELFRDRQSQPVLLKRGAIVTGDQLTDASQGFSEGSPAVFVRLDATGADEMLRTTRDNVGKPMAVLFVEQNREEIERDGEIRTVTRTEREVINVATIQGVFSSSFQITGLDVTEARDLSLLLRAGALAAPIYKVEERTIGPSLGQDNIDRGFNAIIIGFVLVVIFMAIYYRAFGLIADTALLLNLVLMVAILSLLQASLTLPGIAGIVLTVGMAVDANVLIFERIREEVRNGNSPQASIAAGYDKALSTIADANVTTLIAAVVLFAFGTGPIKGFAITLSVGIVTSMFTSIIGTRALVNALFGRRTLERLPIGGAA
ncbi:MAG: protein translocase subunit SecD [Gammaproteobacteria bacterium]|nr:protein translocase subunit SecD [Gammaproteobacteria bacterium]NND54630.1 protein translocase subunit SecD [Gammaproteobacteria bacterium]